MPNVSREIQACIDACLACYQTCLSAAVQHLESDGIVDPAHFRLLMACAEICRTNAHFQLVDGPQHELLCRECAEVCEECADACEALGGLELCVSACRECAGACELALLGTAVAA